MRVADILFVHALKSLGITGVQVRAVCPVGVDDISAAVQKFDADLIVADIFGAGVFHGPFDIEIVSARPHCPVGQNGQVAGRRGTQIFLKRTIVFALPDGVLLALDLRELVYLCCRAGKALSCFGGLSAGAYGFIEHCAGRIHAGEN